MPIYIGATEIFDLSFGLATVDVYLGATHLWPPAAPPSLELVATMDSNYASSQSPVITFATSPVEDDVIFAFVGCQNSFTPNAVTGWTHSIGGVLTVGSAMSFLALHHVVTAAEDSANTVSWTLTTLIPSARSGGVVAAIMRGVDLATPVDAYGTSSHGTAVTPHTLAAVTGTDITSSGGMVLRAIARDGGSGSYPATLTGHTVYEASAGTSQAVWLATLDTPAAAGINIATASITPFTADEGAAITLVVTPT